MYLYKMEMEECIASQCKRRANVPLGGGASSFLGTAIGTFSSGTGFFRTAGTLKRLICFFKNH